MTTCVGSLNELEDLITRIQPKIPLCSKAIRALFYFMRCSQLEHGGGANVVQVKIVKQDYETTLSSKAFDTISKGPSSSIIIDKINKNLIFKMISLLGTVL